MRKFAGRNRLVVGATFAVLASLTIGLSVALWQLHAARVAQQRAEDVKEFIASIFRSADPFFTGNRSMSAVDLLALARQRIDRELQGQPESAMELLNVVGESQANLEEGAAARATLEKAIALGKEVLPSGDPMTAQAQAKLASVFMSDRDYASAKPLLAQSIPVLRKHGAKTARELSDALQVQAEIDSDEGSYDLAIAQSREAYEAVRAVLGAENSETILAKRNWARQLLQAGRLQEALPLAKEALEESKSLTQGGERSALLQETEGFYGRLLIEGDDLKLGIEHLNKAIEIAIQLYGPKSQTEAEFLSYRMRAQLRLGDFEGMIDSTTRAYEASGSDSAAARPLVNLGDAYFRARKFPQAEEILRKAVAAEKKYDTGKGSWLPVAQANYALTLLGLGRIAEAQAMLRDNSPLVGDSKEAITMPHWSAMGQAEGMVGQWVESEEAYRRLLERTTESVASARWKTVAWNGIGIAELELGHMQEADAALRKAEQAVRKAYVNMTPPRADVQVSLTRVLLKENHATEALPLIEEADRFWQSYDANIRWAGEAAYWHGKTLIAAGNKKAAHDLLARAVGVLKKSPISSDTKLAEAAMLAMRE
jgi:tetratricopeptide (TPR) repeat protein